MLWQKCVPTQFCRYIYLKDTFLALTQMEITYQKANATVRKFVRDHPNELGLLKRYLAKNAKVMQYLYATLYPKYYSRNNKFGIQNKSLVDMTYRAWLFNTATANKNKEKLQLAKDPTNYKRSQENISKFEQIPVTEKQQSELQRFALAPLKIMKKNVDTNKAKEQMDRKQERKRKKDARKKT